MDQFNQTIFYQSLKELKDSLYTDYTYFKNVYGDVSFKTYLEDKKKSINTFTKELDEAIEALSNINNLNELIEVLFFLHNRLNIDDETDYVKFDQIDFNNYDETDSKIINNEKSIIRKHKFYQDLLKSRKFKLLDFLDYIENNSFKLKTIQTPNISEFENPNKELYTQHEQVIEYYNLEAKNDKRVNIKYTAKEYALAYIFDLYSKGEQVPTNRTNDAGLDAKYLKSIGSEKTRYNHKGDSFYRAVKDVLKNYDLNNERHLQSISTDWKNAILSISNNDFEIKQYINNKQFN